MVIIRVLQWYLTNKDESIKKQMQKQYSYLRPYIYVNQYN